MYERAFFVPTHRPIEATALERQFQEVAHANQVCGALMPLVVVDDGVSNRDALAAAARRFPRVHAYYFTTAEVLSLYGAVAERLSPEQARVFRKVYPDGRINYGNVYNKMFVLAALFGARQIHRRDSDTYAQTVTRGEERAELFPVELELEWLSKRTPCGKVLLVGGGYTGKWSIDIDHLIQDPDTTHIRRFFDTLSIAEEEHDIVLHEHIHGNSASYEGDVLEPCSVKEPDCGNMAMAEVFEYIPCSPVAYALGGDYFTHASIIECGLGRIYHNRAVVHAHSPCRYDQPEKLFVYWRATACLVVYQHFHRAFWRRLKAEAARRLTPASPLVEVRDLVLATLRSFADEYRAAPDDVRQRLHSFYELIGRKGEPLLAVALERIRAEESSLIDLVRGAVGDQIELLGAWQFVCEAARAAGSEQAVRARLLACRLPAAG